MQPLSIPANRCVSIPCVMRKETLQLMPKRPIWIRIDGRGFFGVLDSLRVLDLAHLTDDFFCLPFKGLYDCADTFDGIPMVLAFDF